MNSPTILVLPIKAPLLSQNGQRRAHWSTVAKAKADHETLVIAAAIKAKLKKCTKPISVRIIWYAPDARKRDVDGLAVLAKSVLDALVKGKYIKDDSSEYVTELHLGPVVIARDNPRIEVVIRDGNP